MRMEYPDWLVSALRDPCHGTPLTPAAGGFISECQRTYPVKEGILSIVHPPALEGMDDAMNRRYRWLAPFYDVSERFLGRLLTGNDMQAGRVEIVDRLALPEGIRLLEVSPGPGVFQRLLRSSIGKLGELVAVDLSMPMLRQCLLLQQQTGAHLIHANGAYLPFADGTFDALFHFGGINLFNEPERALGEFIRVVRPGGVVAYGDEGFAPDYPDGWRKRLLAGLNPGFFRNRPKIPPALTETAEYAVYGGLGYLVIGKRNQDLRAGV